MITKDELLAVLPYRGQEILKEDRQDTDDIRAQIMAAHKKFLPDYDLIYHYFNTGNIVDTSRQIFDFLKTNVPYKKENGRYQTVKSPAAILLADQGLEGPNFDRVDCKNYALFINGVLDAIKRNDGADGWDWCYRFASYNANDPEPGHVFAVVKINDRELWVDPVFTYFNGGDMHEWELDQKPGGKGIGGLYEISGPPDGAQMGTVTVNAKKAARNFLVAVQMGLFNLPQLMGRYPNITFSPAMVKILQDSGVSVSGLKTILQNVKG